MRLPVVNDRGRVRWAVIPDDCAGALDYPVPLRDIVRRRAEIVVAVFSATHGVQQAFAYIRSAFRIQKCDLVAILATGVTRPAQLEALELAFAAAVGRVRLIPQNQRGGRPKKHERTEASAGTPTGGLGEDDTTTAVETPEVHSGDVCELRQDPEVRTESHPVCGVFGDPAGEDAPTDGSQPTQSQK